jgi:hypothetical protein
MDISDLSVQVPDCHPGDRGRSEIPRTFEDDGLLNGWRWAGHWNIFPA